MANNLRSLILKLDNSSKVSLEKALAQCITISSPYVQLEHWLIKLIDSHQVLFEKATDNVVGLSRVYKSLDAIIANGTKQTTRTPAFSEDVISLLKSSWLNASIDFNENQITFLHLLYSALTHKILRQVIVNLSSEFEKISTDSLRGFIKSNPQEKTNKLTDDSVEALKKYTIDITLKAKNNQLEPIKGRNKEIQEVIYCLLRKRQNNPILVAEAGVGKTAVVEGFAQQIIAGSVPDCFKDSIILELDLGLLQAGASIKGEFERRLKSVINAVKNSPKNIILFIDEAHLLIGQDQQSAQMDAANLLKPALARGEIKTIAATTWREYSKYIEKDPALTRRFHLIKLDEPSIETAIDMMRGISASFAKHHDVVILDNAIKEAVLLSDKYITNRFLPDKCISLLDTTCAHVALSQKGLPQKLSSLEYDLSVIDERISILNKERGSKKAIVKLKKESKNIQAKLQHLYNAWHEQKQIVEKWTNVYYKYAEGSDNEKSVHLKELSEVESKYNKISSSDRLVEKCVDSEVIAKIISNWTGIPTGKLLQSEVKNIMDLERKLNKEVIAQEHAVKCVSNCIKNNYAKLSDPRKPLGVFLFLGASGIGKTEMALRLAEHIYGGVDNITTINMSEFKESHKSSLLLGSPPGYVGYGEGGMLTETVRRKPYSLILLDEFEKAHPSVHDIFLQIYDKGSVNDGQGRAINFKNTIIIMTSNIGAKELQNPDNNEIIHNNLLKKIEPALLEHFRPEFLGRIQIVPFLPLKPKEYKQIISIHLDRLVKTVQQQHKIKFNYSESIMEYMLLRCQEDIIGARFIENYISQIITPELSSSVLTNSIQKRKAKNLCLDLDHNLNIVSSFG